jgi:hypothetical protein
MSEDQGKLIAAIAKVMASMGKLSKENMNQFDKYKFTSIDDFLVATGHACGEHGIVILQDELSREIVSKKTSTGKESSWLSFTFSFEVCHESGERLKPLTRSVAVPFTGAQSFGSAQSYALKQFMRSLFQIATGDTDDADFGPNTNEPPDLPAEGKQRPKQKPKGYEERLADCLKCVEKVGAASENVAIDAQSAIAIIRDSPIGDSETVSIKALSDRVFDVCGKRIGKVESASDANDELAIIAALPEGLLENMVAGLKRQLNEATKKAGLEYDKETTQFKEKQNEASDD